MADNKHLSRNKQTKPVEHELFGDVFKINRRISELPTEVSQKVQSYKSRLRSYIKLKTVDKKDNG